MAIKKVIIGEDQSIWDLAAQHYGSVDGVKQLIIDNPTKLNFWSSPPVGSEISIDDTKIINKDIVNLFIEKNIKPATADNTNLPRSFSSGFSNGFR